ncbi:MAG: hypothetical protein IKG23_00130 [Clostridia bacterium]|nr:hypothetical protein [Clostridia bacterium]MBR3494536.1 hypothetical protein [Clostridia bacterium]
MKFNLANYQEVRGKLVKKRKTVFGNHYLYIDDGNKTVSVIIGQQAFALYEVGTQLTVGYIGHQMINIRPGIVKNID